MEKPALFQLGYLNEIGVPGLLSTDRIRAANYYEQAALLDDKPSKKSLSRITRFPEVYVSLHKNEFSSSGADLAPAGMALAREAFKSNDYDRASPIFLWHAKRGNAPAQRAVGIFYKVGLSVDVDLTRFAAWTYLAARNGNRKAQFELGLMYRDSDYLPLSDDDAKKWFRAALNQGVVEAENELGVVFVHPFQSDKKPDPKKAFRHFQKAADLGSNNGIVNLGDAYLDGIGVGKDRNKAKQLYLSAAAKGNLIARRRLYEEYNISIDAKTKDTEKKYKKDAAAKQKSEIQKSSDRLAKKTATALQVAQPRKPTPVELYASLSPAVIKLFALNIGTKDWALSQGSAVAVSKNLAITNCHVIKDKNAFGARFGKKVVRFWFASSDEKMDICIIRSRQNLPSVKQVRKYNDLKIGERVYAIGSPKGLKNTLSEGIISALRTFDDVNYIQTSTPISAGSSGGGLFDDQGRLIGITTFKIRGGENLNFAVAIDEALRVLDRAR